jgi:hypothetical protein
MFVTKKTWGCTHCASLPSWVIVIIILSENDKTITSVAMPFTRPATCLDLTGYWAIMEGVTGCYVKKDGSCMEDVSHA